MPDLSNTPVVLAASWDETPWPTVNTPWCSAGSVGDLIGVDVAATVDVSLWCRIASAWLYRLSGRRYGIRMSTVRPHRLIDSGGIGPVYGAVGALPGWSWGYDDAGREGLVLPAQTRIVEVKVDGTVQTAGTDYLLYDDRLLVRADAGGAHLRWPVYQRLDLADTESGTWSVTYKAGHEVTEEASEMARILTAELCRMAAGDETCRLPSSTVAVTRQGISITVDPDKSANRTGLYVVDRWLETVNPKGLRRRPRIVGPDSMLGARQ